MNSDFVVCELDSHFDKKEDSKTVVFDLIDKSLWPRSRHTVFIILDRSRSAERFANELRNAADNIDRWVKQQTNKEEK